MLLPDKISKAHLTETQLRWAAAARRCTYAHQNGLENFSVFATAMLTGIVTGVPAKTLETAALVFLGARVVYNVVYIAGEHLGLAFVRSALWATGIGACGAIFVAAYRRAH